MRASVSRLLFVAVCLVAVARADEPAIPPKIQKVIERAAAARQERVDFLNDSIARTEANLKRPDPDRTRSTVVEHLASIKKMRSVVAELEAGKVESDELDLRKPRVGGYGKIDQRFKFEVVEVLDGNTMHVIPSWDSTSISFSGLAARQSSSRKEGDRIIVKNVPTEGLADGSEFEPKQWFHFTGTESYETVTGARATCFVLEPLDEKWVPIIRASLRPIPPDHPVRTWADASGSFSVEAKFVRLENQKVTILKQDGRTSEVPFVKLSRADQEYVRKVTAKPKAK